MEVKNQPRLSRYKAFNHSRRRRVFVFIATGVCVGLVVYSLNHGLLSFKHRGRVRRGDGEKCKNGGKWNEEEATCKCKLGWIGKKCNIWHNHYCYFDNGTNYRGKLSITTSGEICKPWTTDENRRFKLGERGIGIHNYCRNPDEDEKGIWCYVGGEKFTSYCNATKCPDALKSWLYLNTSAIQEDDTSAAVQFLFGPVISGVCVGVVALLLFIVIAELARRKRSRKSKEKKKTDLEGGINVPEGENRADHKDDHRSYESKKLGRIITVDFDTGEERIQKFHSEYSVEESTTRAHKDGYRNEIFSRDESSELQSNLQRSPPPPYKVQSEFKSKEVQPVETRGYSQISHSRLHVASQDQPKDVRGKSNSHRPRKRRERRRAVEPPNSSSDSDSLSYVIEVTRGDSSVASTGLSSPASENNSRHHFHKRRRKRRPRNAKMDHGTERARSLKYAGVNKLKPSIPPHFGNKNLETSCMNDQTYRYASSRNRNPSHYDGHQLAIDVTAAKEKNYTQHRESWNVREVDSRDAGKLESNFAKERNLPMIPILRCHRGPESIIPPLASSYRANYLGKTGHLPAKNEWPGNSNCRKPNSKYVINDLEYTTFV